VCTKAGIKIEHTLTESVTMSHCFTFTDTKKCTVMWEVRRKILNELRIYLRKKRYLNFKSESMHVQHSFLNRMCTQWSVTKSSTITAEPTSKNCLTTLLLTTTK
jgi:hypothetical protein